MTAEQVVAVLNPRAGGGRAGRRWREMEWRLQAAGLSIQTRATGARGDAIELARNAALVGTATILAVGGDGTAHEVLNGLLSSGDATRCRMGVVPLGTGTDLARALGVRGRFRDVMRLLTTPRIRLLDVGVAAGPRRSYFLNFAEMGL